MGLGRLAWARAQIRTRERLKAERRERDSLLAVRRSTETRWYCYHDAVLHHLDVVGETPQFLRCANGQRWKKISRHRHWYLTKDEALSEALLYTEGRVNAAAEAWRHWTREDATVHAWINAVERQERRDRQAHLVTLLGLLKQLCEARGSTARGALHSPASTHAS